MGIEWRSDAPQNLVELEVGRCLQATMDGGKWQELGLLTNTRDAITDHARLLRSLFFGDDDYDACVLEVVPAVLGVPRTPAFPQFPPPPAPTLFEKFPNLEVVAEYLDLPVWVAENNPRMFDRFFEAAPDDADSTMPDGTLLSAAEAAASRLEVGEMRRQVDRIRRDHADDPEAAVGQAKELIETVCKTILGLTGDAPDTKDDLPKLVARTQLHLGLDPSQVGDDGVAEARAAKRMLGGVSSVLNGAGELRNARGTGHGRSGTPVVDAALARFAVGAVLAAVVYLIEMFEAQTGGAQPPELTRDSGELSAATQPSAWFTPPLTGVNVAGPPPELFVGSIVVHGTFGEGQVLELAGEGTKQIATVEFGGEIGQKRLLVRYAGLAPGT